MATASAHTTLQDELKLIACLVDLMKQEQQLLVAADTGALATLTPLKNQLIEQMAALAGQRHRSLEGDGFAGSESGMQDWLARMNSASAGQAWEQLLEKTREAKELNRVNGMLINKHLTHNQVLINAMRAPAGVADTGMYGPSGQTAAVQTPRRLVVG